MACDPAAAWPAAAYSTLGCTAPTNIRPPSVISTETRLVRSSRPLPQAPLTGVADCSSAFSTAALSPAGLSPEPPLPLGAVSPAEGRSSTVSQPDPMVLTSPRVWSEPDGALRFTWVTLAPGGGVKVRSAGAGVTNWMEV